MADSKMFGRSTSSSPPLLLNVMLAEDSSDTTVGSHRQCARKLQPNLTRRTHTKSRAGCFVCKARKIKCGEERPACKNCQIKSADCTYPPLDNRKVCSAAKRPSLLNSPSPTSVSFSLHDMQCFHNFLTLSYPHLPLGNDDVWVRDIPQFAQDHSYLMHAMLALGASHLACTSSSQLDESSALSHRTMAIQGLNKALAKTDFQYGEADAVLAACYVLMFQSSYLAGGLSEFVTFARMCALATSKIRDTGAETAFDLHPQRHLDILLPRLRRIPTVNLVHVFAGLESLEGMQQYVIHAAELEFYHILHTVFTDLLVSSTNGYLTFGSIFMVWRNLDHTSLQQFIDPNNATAQLLLAHFIGLQLLLFPISILEWPSRVAKTAIRAITGTIAWFHDIERRLPIILQHHISWMQSIFQIATAELSGLTLEGPAVLSLTELGRPLSECIQEHEFIKEASTASASPL